MLPIKKIIKKRKFGDHFTRCVAEVLLRTSEALLNSQNKNDNLIGTFLFLHLFSFSLRRAL